MSPLSPVPDRLSQSWTLAPPVEVARNWIVELEAKLGWFHAAEVLTIESWRLKGYVSGEFLMNLEQMRVVWYAWSIFCKPQNLRSKLDILTWGRFVE